MSPLAPLMPSPPAVADKANARFINWRGENMGAVWALDVHPTLQAGGACYALGVPLEQSAGGGRQSGQGWGARGAAASLWRSQRVALHTRAQRR